MQSKGEYGEVFNYLMLPRVESWLIEQAILRSTAQHWKPPSALMQKRWPGYTELREMDPAEVFEMAERLYEHMQEVGRYEFAAIHIPCSPHTKKKLIAKAKEAQ